jgi:hypothetical protein
MDIDIQEFSNFGGFADDSEYGNFLGSGTAANRINAQTDQIKAQMAALSAATDADSQKIAQQVAASEKAAKDALEKAEMIKNALEDAKTAQKNAPVSTAQSGAKSNMPLIIGGGILVVGIVVVLILKK